MFNSLFQNLWFQFLVFVLNVWAVADPTNKSSQLMAAACAGFMLHHIIIDVGRRLKIDI